MGPNIEGAEKIIEWFGYWPTFHDCRIEELRIAGNECVMSIAAFETMLDMDSEGTYKTAKHCIVSFRFDEVLDLQLTCEGPLGAIIFEMECEDSPDGSIALRWNTSAGVEGRIRARTCRVQLNPSVAI